MTSYRRLPPVQATSAADQSGKNQGNLTAAFTAAILPRVNEYEIYHMVVTGGPALAFARIVVGGKSWSYVILDANGGNEWDPATPLMMARDFEMYFLWSLASSVTPAPVVTVWPRFDADNPANRAALTA